MGERGLTQTPTKLENKERAGRTRNEETVDSEVFKLNLFPFCTQAEFAEQIV